MSKLSRKNAFRLAFIVLILFFIISFSIFDSSNSLNQVFPSKTTTKKTKLKPLPEATTTDSTSESPSTQLTDFHRVETKSGKKLWEVKGKVAIYSDSKPSQKLANPELNLVAPLFTYYDEQDQPAYKIKSDTANLLLGLKGLDKVDLSGAVELTAESKYTLTSEKTIYYGKTEDVEIPADVTISGDGFKVTARQLKGNLSSEKFILQGKVNTYIAAK